LEDELDDKYYLSDKAVEGLLNHKKRAEENGWGFGAALPEESDKMNALKVGGKGKDDVICVAMRGRNPDNPSDRTPVSSTQLRRLTPTECARLQTIPDWYEWVVSDTQQYKMLGNGWTVEVIKHIFQYL
jgi:DNA (cytosine-5)-methyltransferase 3A